MHELIVLYNLLALFGSPSGSAKAIATRSVEVLEGGRPKLVFVDKSIGESEILGANRVPRGQ